jgi:hypothetical protein
MTREQKIQEILRLIAARDGTIQQLSEDKGLSVTTLYRLKREPHSASDKTLDSALEALNSTVLQVPMTRHDKYVRLSEELVSAFGNRKAASIFGIAPGTMYGYRHLPQRLEPLHDELLAEARRHPEAVPLINKIYGAPQAAEPEVAPATRSEILKARAAEAMAKWGPYNPPIEPAVTVSTTQVTMTSTPPVPLVYPAPTPTPTPAPAEQSAAPSALDLKNSEWKVVVRKDLDRCIIYGKRMVFKSLDNVHVLVQIGD